MEADISGGGSTHAVILNEVKNPFDSAMRREGAAETGIVAAGKKALLGEKDSSRARSGGYLAAPGMTE